MLSYQQSFPVTILIFTLPGCPACVDYVPRVQRMCERAQRAGYCVAPVREINPNDPDPTIRELVKRFDVNYTPTTVLLKYNGRFKKVGEEALSDEVIQQVLSLASRGLHCEL